VLSRMALKRRQKREALELVSEPSEIEG
jgi:hypothetical protein